MTSKPSAQCSSYSNTANLTLPCTRKNSCCKCLMQLSHIILNLKKNPFTFPNSCITTCNLTNTHQNWLFSGSYDSCTRKALMQNKEQTSTALVLTLKVAFLFPLGEWVNESTWFTKGDLYLLPSLSSIHLSIFLFGFVFNCFDASGPATLPWS